MSQVIVKQAAKLQKNKIKRSRFEPSYETYTTRMYDKRNKCNETKSGFV